MSQETLLLVIAIATAINAAAWLIILILGIYLVRVISSAKNELLASTQRMSEETASLVREARRAVGSFGDVLQMGGRVGEKVLTAVIIDRIAPESTRKMAGLRVGVALAKEGLRYLRSHVR